MSLLKSGLFRRFVAVMGALALLPVGLLSYQLLRVQRGIQDSVLELQTKLAEKLAEKVDAYFKDSNDNISFALASLEKPMDWDQKQQLLRSLIETHSDIIEISMVSPRGQELLKVYNPDLSSRKELVSRAKEPAFLEFLRARRRVLSIGRQDGEPVAVFYYPMTAAVTARLELSLKELGQSIAAERVGGTGFAVMTDDRGRPLLYPAQKLSAADAAAFPKLSIVAAALESNSEGSTEFAGREGRMVGAYHPVYSTGGAVIILQPRADAYRAAIAMKRAAAWAIFLVVLLCAAASTLLARQLTKPLLALSSAAEAVSRGDFDAKVDVRTRDELQHLADTFNRMTAQLRRYSELQVDRLVAEQRKTAAILFSIGDGILMIDGQKRIQLANPRAVEALGLERSAVLEGHEAPAVLPSGTLRDAVLAAAENPEWDLSKDLDLSTEQHHRYVRVASRPVVTPKGERLGVLIALRDITLERELEKMKEDFLHYITHDLRNPLGSAMGFLDVLLKGTAGVLNPDQQSIVSSVKRSTSRLMGLVNNILDIAKMDAGGIRLQLKTVSLAGIAGRSISILESLAKARKIDVQLAATEEFSLEADGDLLERVFTNLLGNAIKYTPEAGLITVSLVDEGTHIKACVADTGEGIPKDYLERIFNKFEQVQGQRRGGTGLGLTIARFFVESHLGRIWVESELGKGSQFYFTIPKGLALRPDGSAAVAEAPSAQAAS